MDFNHIKEILAKQLSISEDIIKPESKIISDLGADSISILMLLKPQNALKWIKIKFIGINLLKCR